VAVAVRSKHLLATAFHPELTDDLRWCAAGRPGLGERGRRLLVQQSVVQQGWGERRRVRHSVTADRLRRLVDVEGCTLSPPYAPLALELDVMQRCGL